ncbi:MAG TPA: LD-carboxypeptidase [Tepidisphaeraceae bacterium]|nr:LD-carboxypeptidase [Tepidisphaeraceae bacterium]
MSSRNRIGIFAASSIVPMAEFGLGVQILRDKGFEVTIHSQVSKEHFIYPGTDEERATALYELACDDNIEILWAARGGYGASRLLPMLDSLTRKQGKPKRKKLIVGYSDVTVLHEFARHHWGFATLHASMPAGMSFAQLSPEDQLPTLACARGEPARFAWEQTELHFITAAPKEPIEAEIVGGNLAMWQCVIGTPYAGDAHGKILFLEDVDERPYRIDRMLTQLVQSGGLDGVRAIILGDFTSCDDESSTCLNPLEAGENVYQLLEGIEKRERIPLRKVYPLDEALREIFGTVGERLKIPVAVGLPVGHGPNYSPLPLGTRYRLSPQGTLQLLHWDWTAAQTV